MELGGAPIRNDDWKFDQDAVRDALKGVASVLGANALLSGCVPSPSGGGYVFTQGYVLINGEVFFVPAVTTPIPFDEDGNYFQIQESDVSPDGDVVMENSDFVNIYKQRIAVIGYDANNLPPNAISWLTAFNNRFAKKAYNAVMAETIFPQKGIFWKRLSGAPLTIVSGVVNFDSKNGNFASVTTADSTIEDINLSLSGGLQPILFALKVIGSGYLKIEHGSGIICPDARNHYFKQNDIVLFMNDGGIPTAVTHLVSIGDEDSGWHEVTSVPAGWSAVDLRYRKRNNSVVIDGRVQIVDLALLGSSGVIFKLPADYVPARSKYLAAMRFNSTPSIGIGAGCIVVNGLEHPNPGTVGNVVINPVYGDSLTGSDVYYLQLQIPLD